MKADPVPVKNVKHEDFHGRTAPMEDLVLVPVKNVKNTDSHLGTAPMEDLVLVPVKNVNMKTSMGGQLLWRIWSFFL